MSWLNLPGVLKPTRRTKNNRELTSVDLLEAADMLRLVGSAAPGTDDRTRPANLL